MAAVFGSLEEGRKVLYTSGPGGACDVSSGPCPQAQGFSRIRTVCSPAMFTTLLGCFLGCYPLGRRWEAGFLERRPGLPLGALARARGGGMPRTPGGWWTACPGVEPHVGPPGTAGGCSSGWAGAFSLLCLPSVGGPCGSPADPGLGGGPGS